MAYIIVLGVISLFKQLKKWYRLIKRKIQKKKLDRTKIYESESERQLNDNKELET